MRHGRLGKWVKKEDRFLQKLSILNKAGSLVGFRYQCLGRLIWMLSRENIWPCVVSTVYVLACVLFVSTPCITRGEKQMFRGPDSSHSNLAKIGRGGSWPKHAHFHQRTESPGSQFGSGISAGNILSQPCATKLPSLQQNLWRKLSCEYSGWCHRPKGLV